MKNPFIIHMKLTLEGPVFIGSGMEIGKKEYIYDYNRRVVRFLDPIRFQRLLIEHNLQDAYERYMLNGSEQTLYKFCNESGLTPGQVASAVRYELPAGKAIGDTSHQPANVQTFVRNARGEPYIPGSSIKGMLRTALLVHFVLENHPQIPHPMSIGSQSVIRGLETQAFHTLNQNIHRADDAVNSILRGLSVADSMPLKAQMILCRKVDGDERGCVHSINVIRECLAPGLTVDIPITLLLEYAGWINLDLLKSAVREFSSCFTSMILDHFDAPDFDTWPSLEQHLFLGGGCGYPTKTVAMPWLGRDEGLRQVAAMMQRFFPRHGHDRDIERGVSPHTLKYADMNGKMVPMGLCKVVFV